MNPDLPRATGAVCLLENGAYLVVFVDGDREIARVCVSPHAMPRLRESIDEALSLDAQVAQLGRLEGPAGAEHVEWPPLAEPEARVVVGSALRRIAPTDGVVGFTLYARPDGRFDWALEDAGPPGALYDHAVREALGAQAGAPRGTPMGAPTIE